MRGVALAIALAVTPAIALADSTTVDLSTTLAAPPSSDYVEATPSATILDGPFTAQQYADFVTAIGANSGDIKTAFTADGFKRGFARSWVERRTQRILVERVFELSSGSGATSLYSQLKLGAQTASSYRSDIDTSSIPNSFGMRADTNSGGTTVHEFVGAFVKGNDVYIVDMGSFTEDLTSEFQSQATAEYFLAPNETIPRSQWTSRLTVISTSPAFQAGSIIAGLIVLVLVLGVLLLVVGLMRRGSRARPALVGVSMSPDGAYWWDGVQWRDASRDAPAMAPRSPDGAYWWDGRMWRPLPAPRC